MFIFPIYFRFQILLLEITSLGVFLGTDNSVLSSVISLKYIELDRIKVSAKHNASSSKSPSPKINLDEEEEDLLDAQLNYFFLNERHSTSAFLLI